MIQWLRRLSKRLASLEIDIERCLTDDMTLRSFQSSPRTNVNFDNEHGTEKIEMGRLYSQYLCGTGRTEGVNTARASTVSP